MFDYIGMTTLIMYWLLLLQLIKIRADVNYYSNNQLTYEKQSIE